MKPRDLPSTADDATALAFTVWGLPAGESTWDLFTPSLRRRLSRAWSARSLDADQARDRLATEHVAESQPDLARRIHVSWWVRALREESPAVQRAVVRSLPSDATRQIIARALNLDPIDVTQAQHTHRVAALDLWTDRLVGGLPRSGEDPAVVTTLTALEPCRLYRIVHQAALVKRAAVRGDDPIHNAADPQFLRVAEPDIEAHPHEDRRSTARLGLVTIGRLLTDVEPHRTRWVLQHLPYPIAKVIRAEREWMNPLPSAWLRGEQKVLQQAIDQAGGRT